MNDTKLQDHLKAYVRNNINRVGLNLSEIDFEKDFVLDEDSGTEPDGSSYDDGYGSSTCYIYIYIRIPLKNPTGYPTFTFLAAERDCLATFIRELLSAVAVEQQGEQ